MNYLLFDKDYNFIDGGYEEVTSAGDFSQELVSFSRPIIVTEAGYLFVYLSNESNTANWVYFDDLKITQTKSSVIQSDDYYPFGLTFNSYQRENATPNRWKFQGQEHIDDLDLGWDSFKWRNHMPDIGRFFNVDPLASDYTYNSPYAFAENKLGLGIELEGLELYQLTGSELEVAQANGQVPSDYEPTHKQEVEMAGGTDAWLMGVMDDKMKELGTPTVSFSVNFDVGATREKIIKNIAGAGAKVGAIRFGSIEIKKQLLQPVESTRGGLIANELTISSGATVSDSGINGTFEHNKTVNSDGFVTNTVTGSVSFAGFGVEDNFVFDKEGVTRVTNTGFTFSGGGGSGMVGEFKFFIGFEKKRPFKF